MIVATLAAALVVCGVVAVVGDGYADQRRHRFSGRWVTVAAVLAVVTLSVVGFRRLDRNGGVRTFGVESRGGDLLAMGFPLFALLAITAVSGLIVATISPRLRLTGSKLARAIRLGWRRVVLDTGPLVAVIVSAALAAGCFTAAARWRAAPSNSSSTNRSCISAATSRSRYSTTSSCLQSWTAPTTATSRIDVKRGDVRGELMGIDRATFGSVATLRSDGADQPLAELVDSVTPAAAGQAPLPAIAVGADASVGDVVTLELPGGVRTLDVEVVSVADFFPAKSSRIEMFVVDRTALQEAASFAGTTLLIADPPTDAVEQLRAAGVRTGVVLDVDGSFDGSAYSALRWAYAPLATLGAWFAIVALALQLLVVSARRTQRRIADAVMRRTGLARSGLWWASAIETGVPPVGRLGDRSRSSGAGGIIVGRAARPDADAGADRRLRNALERDHRDVVHRADLDHGDRHRDRPLDRERRPDASLPGISIERISMNGSA